ncbi:MAG: hypothetical protein M1143_00225, partial [Candidatus Thermoplasmatota archaeon]|nr:hypothetical protein [Candidatus Thermoplasmatota archaeon]
AEKNLGWYVTYTDIAGVSHTDKVTANPALYATNGLVSDYVAKEFGLNPTKIDTAGSHMLDTYNLTFDLGSNGVPSNIRAWTEPSVNPFQFAPAPSVLPPKGQNPIGVDWTNLSDMPTAGDNHPWSSEVLWDYNNLLYLNGLAYSDGDWLRGVTGSWNGHNTLTVWGKLSWGANPLAASTPGDGISDGARVNPLHEEDLQIFVYKSGLLSCGESLNQGAGYANQFFVNTTNSAGQNGATLFHGFSASGFDTDGNCNPIQTSSGPLPFNILDYFLVIPAGGQTTQYVHIDTQLVANNNLQGKNTLPLQELPITNHCQDTVSMTVDLVNPPYAPFQSTGSSLPVVGSCSSGANPAFIAMGATAVPAGVKSQTFLWLPNDNSTLSSLPQGLQRYTGEQNFFLVTANVTELPKQGTYDETALTSDPIPEPWSSTNTYTVNIPLTTGISPSPTHALVNFLIPRAQFLASPFGQAVLLNTEVPGASSLEGPLLSDIFPSASDQNQQAIECYWQTNAFTSGTTVTGCGGTGPFPDPFHSVQVLSLPQGATAASCEDSYPSLCGGVPGNSALSAVSPSPALQGVIALNLSILDSSYNPSPVDLDTLLAGLLDNSTGGVNGTFRDETQNLSSLGLNPVVMEALANGVWDSGGIFGAPVSYGQPNPPSPPGCSNFVGCVWNTVSGVVVGIAGAIYGVVWTAVTAATQFMKQLAAGLAQFAEDAEEAAVSALTAVGAALEAALEAIGTFIYGIVKTLFITALGLVIDGLKSAIQGQFNLIQSATKNVLNLYEERPSGTFSQTVSSMNLAMAPLLLLAGGEVAAVDIAFGITAPFSIGASVIVGLLITALIAALGSSPGDQQSGGILGFVNTLLAGPIAGMDLLIQYAEQTFNFTEKNVLHNPLQTRDIQPLSGTSGGNSNGDFFGELGVILAAGALGVSVVSSIALLKAKGGADLMTQLGLFLSFIAVDAGLVAFLSLLAFGGCSMGSLGLTTIEVEDTVAFLAGLFGAIVSGLSFLNGGVTKTLSAIGLGLGGAGIVGPAAELIVIHGC